jgi:hypothetical protein
MTSPKTPQQLADAIEALVASYLDDARRSAQQAVERVLSSPSATTGRTAKSKSAQPRHSTGRRSAAQLEALCEKLHELVCRRPGESMVVLSDEIGVGVRELQRPMSKLKTGGRVHSVGQRSLMRYFPAVARPSASVG